MHVSECSNGESKLSLLLKRVRDVFTPAKESVITDDQWERNCRNLTTQYNDLLASFNGLKNELSQIQMLLESKQPMGKRITASLARINNAKSSLDEYSFKGERH